MISEPLEPGRWRLTFSEPEAVFLMNVLTRLARHYEEDIAGLPAAQRVFWQSGSSAPSTPDGEESREVLAEARAELRSERRLLAENWLREFEITEQRDPWMVELTTAERDEFVAMLNDRRLILGLEIATPSENQAPEIPEEARRVAIMEIDVLGHFIMVALGPQIFRS